MAARYNPDGTPDTSFGTGGQATTDVGPGLERAQAILIQPDGKIVVTGSSATLKPGRTGTLTDDYQYSFLTLRYLPNGTLDAGFGSGGEALSDVGSIAYGVALQSDGKIVVAGQVAVAGNETYGLIRYNPDGMPDASFGTAGRVVGLATGGYYGVQTFALQDGKFLLGGTTIMPGGASFVWLLARLNADGTPDGTFGTTGRAVINVSAGVTGRVNDHISGLAMQSDGKIVAVGDATGAFAVARFQSNGELDPTFGTAGVVTIPNPLSPTDEVSAGGLVLQPDGKILFNGSVARLSDRSSLPIMGRLNPDGTPDGTFGTSGISQAAFASTIGILLQPDGKVVALGSMALSRLWTAAPPSQPPPAPPPTTTTTSGATGSGTTTEAVEQQVASPSAGGGGGCALIPSEE